ncbi:MAG: D-arabinono-1,4-lactone oxidase, partial [Elsteraceae bacterium]
DLFRATVGGLGLTGMILNVGLKMRAAPSNAIDLDERRVADLDQFLTALKEARETNPYAVGWIDALATGKKLGRGVLELGRPAGADLTAAARKPKRLPIDLPGFLLNPWTIRAFNMFYYNRIGAGGRMGAVPVGEYLYPLDSLLDWNRMYGKRGFHQFQCLLPDEHAPDGMRRLLETVSAAGAASFLAVIKSMGGPGLGFLSFAGRGFTLALDIPHRAGSLDLLRKLEQITLDHGGRIYLAKDSALSPEGFRAMYPEHKAFQTLIDDLDPERLMTSDMARRLGLRP